MDEEDVVRVGMEVVLRPITDITADVLGFGGGDWLHEQRIRARARLQEKTRKILHERNVSPQDASPTILLPLLTAAQDEGREELLDLWAKLLAAALDPKKAVTVRREFIEAVRQMEPFDVFVLENWGQDGMNRSFLGHHRNSDKVCVSLQHLNHLGCVGNPGSVQSGETTYTPNGATALTPFGRELLSMLREGV